jgi:O-antigen ligase
MTEVGREPGASWLSVIWSARHDPDARLLNVDLLAVLVAILLPWSTSGVSIALALWLIALAFTVEPRALVRSLARPACALPIAFFALALLGTLWSDAAWSARLHGVSPLAKFLALPLIIYHFERSPRGLWVFVAFLASCALLALMSCVAALNPDLSAKLYFSHGPYRQVSGIFVKNYIDQGQEFTLCAVALAYPIVTSLREGRRGLALLLAAAAVWLVANMLFVVVSRTALVTMPIMLAVFALLHLRWRTAVATLCVAALIMGAVWYASSSLRTTVAKFLADYEQSEVRDNPSGMGSRLEYWRKSLRFIADAPLIGHGTGSTRGLFAQAAEGQAGFRAEIVGDPHNQTLNVAVQWGALGVVMLYALWFVHLRLFRGEGLAAWIGLLVVVQNVFSSLLNSHLFDFNEGWLYVLGVGIAGGMVLGAREAERVR